MKRILTVFGLMVFSAFPLLAFTNGQTASYVLGQPNFTSSAGATTPSRMNGPEKMAYDSVHQWLFVCDSDNNRRVLVFDLSNGVRNGMNAVHVLGQYNFTSNFQNITGAINFPTANGFVEAAGLAYDQAHQRLFVADSWYARILVFDLSNGISDGMNASWVLGQPNLTFLNPSPFPPTQSNLNGPIGLVYDPVNQRLLVADSVNNRVVGFDLSVSTTVWNGMNASWVWGQVNFTSNAAATSQSGMKSPQDVTYDPTVQRLLVADGGNNRVLGFDLSQPPANWNDGTDAGGMNATWVLGQTNFTSAASAVTQAGMNADQGLSYDPATQQLFVTDLSNHRMLIFDLSAGITNGMNANTVLGQYDFTSNSVANGLTGRSVFYDSSHQRLFAADIMSNRVLIYNNPIPSPPVWCNGQNATNVLGQPDFTAITAGIGPNALSAATASAYDSTHQRLFVSDYFNNRVLLFDLSGGITNGMSAVSVLGQPDLTSNSNREGQNGFTGPGALSYDPVFQRLFVADSNWNRILVFDLAGGIPNFMNATYVIGQTDFNTFAAGVAPNKFGNYVIPLVDPTTQRLYVSDSTNRRVMVFDLSGGIQNGMSAAYVLGQTDLSSNVSGSPSAHAMARPLSLAIDPIQQRLFVGDITRILVFELSGGISNDMDATYVLGQPNFTSSSFSGAAQNHFQFTLSWYSNNMVYDPNYQQLFVADTTDWRVLQFDLSGGITNNMNASNYWGGSSFSSVHSGAGSNMLANPNGLSYDAAHQRLFVPEDSANNRVLSFASGQGCVGGGGPPGGGLPAGCGASTMICGSVSAADSPGTYLPNVPIQLRDVGGNLVANTKTNDSGGYSFGSNGLALTAGSTYYVVPLVGPRQSAMPLNYPVTNLPVTGAIANLAISAWPATIEVTGNQPGSFILISTFNYTGSYPPSMSAALSSGAFYSSSVGLDGKALIPVPTAASYYITSWVSQMSGSSVTHNRIPAAGSSPLGVSVTPGQIVTIPAPS